MTYGGGGNRKIMLGATSLNSIACLSSRAALVAMQQEDTNILKDSNSDEGTASQRQECDEASPMIESYLRSGTLGERDTTNERTCHSQSNSGDLSKSSSCEMDLTKADTTQTILTLPGKSIVSRIVRV